MGAGANEAVLGEASVKALQLCGLLVPCATGRYPQPRASRQLYDTLFGN